MYAPIVAKVVSLQELKEAYTLADFFDLLDVSQILADKMKYTR